MEENKKSSNLAFVVLSIFLGLVAVGIIGFLLGKGKTEARVVTKAVKEAVTEELKPNQTWVMPIANGKIIPIVKSGTLFVYDRNSKKLIETKYKTSDAGGAAGLGSDNPLMSPDNGQIVFIGTNRNLFLLTAGVAEAKKLTDYPVSYITGWSPNSQRILFSTVTEDNLVSRKQPEGMGEYPEWDTSESFKKGNSPGFHIFDLKTGVDTNLYPLTSAEKFVDNNRIMSFVKQYTNDDKGMDRIVLFNVDTFTADYSLVKGEIPFGGQQITFDAQGKMWAFTDNSTPHGTDGQMMIKYAIFPDRLGTTIASDSWALVQDPIISSNGKYVAYAKRGEMIKQGQFKNLTVVWDTVSNKEVGQFVGWTKFWVDNKTFLAIRNPTGANNSALDNNQFVLIDVEIGSEEIIK